jgi:hypothetical protein
MLVRYRTFMMYKKIMSDKYFMMETYPVTFRKGLAI